MGLDINLPQYARALYKDCLLLILVFCHVMLSCYCGTTGVDCWVFFVSAVDPGSMSPPVKQERLQCSDLNAVKEVEQSV